MDMFSMFTADAAAKHGHEFSRSNTMPSPGSMGNREGAGHQQANMRLPRSPLSVLPRARPQSTLSRQRQRPHSMKITMAELKEDPEGEKADEEEELRKIEAKIRSFTIPGAFQDTPPSSRTSAEHESEDTTVSVAIIPPTTSPSPLSSEDVDVTIVSKSTSTSEDTSGESGTGTDASGLRRNANRPRVFYRLGRPVHAERRHVLRPKCLLQVQEPQGKFHRPLFDVVPGSRFNPRTKIGQKLRRLKRNKDGTGADDLVVVKSEHKHESKDDSEEEEHDHEHETLNGREVLGTIQPAEDGPSAYITLGETVWKAELDGRGSSYTLENASDPSERARWYVPKSKRVAAANGGPREFSFASLQPGSKRHPIIAGMSEGHLEFFEEYISPLDPNTVVATDEAMRRLITVSGLWVYFCEGWSKHYDFHSAVATSSRPTPGRSQSTRSCTERGRSIRGMLRSRSPSRSPAPSIRCAASVSSDTRSREGSHDSTITATTTTASSTATTVRHSIAHSSTTKSAPTPSELRIPSPDPHSRGRRRWSTSLTLPFRRMSHSIKQHKEHRASMSYALHHQHEEVKETIITADLLAVEDLSTPVDIDQHPLQKAFIQPEMLKVPTTLLVSASAETMIDLPPLPGKQPFAVYPESPAPPKSPVREALAKLEGTSSSQVPEPSTPVPPQVDGTTEEESMPHRFGLGDLARPKDIFTRHERSDSSSSNDSQAGGSNAGWWSQYDRMVQRGRGSMVVPTSPNPARF